MIASLAKYYNLKTFSVSSLTTGARVEEAMKRSVRWLDRCIVQHKKAGRQDTQNLFAIVQGGLDPKLRDQCLDAMIERRDGVAGYAIGGLSGGEEKGMCSLLDMRILYHHRYRCLLEDVSVLSGVILYLPI